MFNARLKSTGIDLTTTATFPIAAFILSLTVLAASRAFGPALLSLAMACMTLSLPFHSRSLQTIGTVE